MSATLSLIALYQYNHSLFNGLKLPNSINRDIFIDNLLVECAEFEILYSDPEFLGNMISVWSGKQLSVWEKLEDTLNYEYDPISNYDRKEEWKDDNEEKSENNGNSLGKVAGFNSTELVESSGAETLVTRNASNISKKSGRMWGNIGVTTTQKMINEQREVVKFNLSDYIIDEFKRRFCLMIY